MRMPNVVVLLGRCSLLYTILGASSAAAVRVKHSRSGLRSVPVNISSYIASTPEGDAHSDGPQREGESTTSPDIWNIHGSEGGSDKQNEWRKDKGGGNGPWFASVVFICILAIPPLIPFMRKNAKPPTKWDVFEGVGYFIWLISGFYFFTNIIYFQSPHFREPRSLSLEEACYLISQIVTTVGYGDVTPAHKGGQIFVGCFVFFAIMFVSKMLGEMVAMFQDIMEDMIMDDADQSNESNDTPEKRLWNAFIPVIQSGAVFVMFVVLGTLFFWLYPGEGKTFQQGVYMSMITLSSVGFGAFTPVTHAGMVFGAYWMLFGVGALASFVSARVAFHTALVRHESAENDELKS